MAYKENYMQYCEDMVVSLVVIVGGKEKERGGVKLVKVATKDEV